MPLKPNATYWFWARNNEPYIEGQTELHEGVGPDKNNCKHIRTDEAGEIVRFKQVGEIIDTRAAD